MNESNPVVGSSKKISCGSVISSTPIDVLFLSPPDIPLTSAPPTLVFWHLVNLRSLITSSTLSIYFSEVHLSFSFAAKMRHSLTVIV